MKKVESKKKKIVKKLKLQNLVENAKNNTKIAEGRSQVVGAEGVEGGSQGAEAAEGRSRAEALRAVTKVPAPKVLRVVVKVPPPKALRGEPEWGAEGAEGGSQGAGAEAEGGGYKDWKTAPLFGKND